LYKKKEVFPGDLIDARIDIALGNNITAPLAIQAFEEMGAKKVFHRDRVVLVPDHFTAAKDILSAEQCNILRDCPSLCLIIIPANLSLRPGSGGHQCH
jgi:3-isopropylmalate/(R)-2-methylmalate dehydratase large subunit